MLDQFNRITQAVEILNSTSGTPQERLVKGFKAFYRATIVSDDWPAPLWDQYNGICETLLAGGTLQNTADGMDLETAGQCARQVAKDMTDLAAAVELARTQRLIPHPVIAPLPGEDDPRADPAEFAEVLTCLEY
jgi:hypothetical protein